MVTDGNYTFNGENFVIYIVIEYCYTPETYIILYVSWTYKNALKV